MATFTFDRPLKLTPEDTEKFLEIASKPAEPDGIEPIPDSYWKEVDEFIEQWYESQRKKK